MLLALFIAGNAFHGCWVALWAVCIIVVLIIGAAGMMALLGREKQPPKRKSDRDLTDE